MTDRLIVIREYEQYKDRIKMNNTIITWLIIERLVLRANFSSTIHWSHYPVYNESCNWRYQFAFVVSDDEMMVVLAKIHTNKLVLGLKNTVLFYNKFLHNDCNRWHKLNTQWKTDRIISVILLNVNNYSYQELAGYSQHNLVLPFGPCNSHNHCTRSTDNNNRM
jgi:hypothetical protein